jgi:hypothetical protein
VVAAVYAEGGRDLAASSKALATAIFGAITNCKDLTDALKVGQVSSFRLAVEGTTMKRRADASCTATALEGTAVAPGNAGNYAVFIEVGPPAP